MNPPLPAATDLRRVLLVGRPNVGKSAFFGALTGVHAHVSNYPGTTVTVSHGEWDADLGDPIEVIDTPGCYSMLPVTDEERVARDALFAGPTAAVLHVVEAANIDRTLSTTIELIDAGFPVVLALNMWDEAERVGVTIDVAALEARLGCPVVKTVAVSGKGLDELRDSIKKVMEAPPRANVGDFWVEEFGEIIDELAEMVPPNGLLPPAMPARIVAALTLRGSRDITERSGIDPAVIERARAQVRERVAGMPPVAAILALRERAKKMLEGVFERPDTQSETFQHRLGMVLAHPLMGLPFLAIVLYFGFYQLVGVWVAGEVVGFLEEDVFGRWLMAPATRGVEALLPWKVVSSLFVGEYGILTLGITYALALVLPVVGAFFLLFAMVEDSGYFPRLALLCDRLFKFVGLNGRAVITMVLGFGCSTMATVTTRTLENPRDRIIATLLLVLTVPCSAQLGLITALLASRGNFMLWLTYVICLVLMFTAVGFAATKFLPGRNATFHMELVPMRLPRVGNVVRKTWHRLYWYFREVVPLFVYASILLWALTLESSTLFGFTDAAQADAACALDRIRVAIEPLMALLDQPKEAAEAFLIGFFRRDFAAAELYELGKSGELIGGARLLSDRQLLVASFTITLFVPCIATFMMMAKERGLGLAVKILILVTILAVTAGAFLNQILVALGWG